MKVTAEQLAKINSPNLQFVTGNLKTSGTRPLPPEVCLPGSTVYVSTPEQLQKALQNKAHLIISLKKIIPTELTLNPDQALFSTHAMPASMSLVNAFFDQKLTRFPDEIHSTAVVHESAKLGKDVRLGAFVVIGENVNIGDGTIIGPHCVLEKNVKVGVASLLHASVFVGADSEIGNHCEIHPHVTIGSDGFGFVVREKEAPQKIPQLGKVVIEDDVEIGGNCVIDRGALTETRICKSTKLDNLVHIAHNCKIGPNSLLAAGFMIAGSSEIGSNFMCGGDVVVADHVKVTDNVSLGGRATVTKNITQSGAYTGYPLVEMTEGLKYIASLPKVPELRRQLLEVRRHLGLEKSE